MPTFDALVKAGHVVRYAKPIWESRDAIREVYVTPELFDWADENPTVLSVNHGSGNRSRLEHLEQLFCDLMCATRPGAGDLRRLMPTNKGVWKLHPYGLRVYGWFPKRGVFVAVAGALLEDTKKDKSLNDRMRDKVEAFILQHGLKDVMVRGDINAVV